MRPRPPVVWACRVQKVSPSAGARGVVEIACTTQTRELSAGCSTVELEVVTEVAVCVCFFFLFFGGLASCGGLCPCLFRHLSFLTSPLAIQTYSRSHLSPYSLLHASTSAPPRPSGTSVSPPPSTQDSTIHTLCDNLSTEKVN